MRRALVLILTTACADPPAPPPVDDTDPPTPTAWPRVVLNELMATNGGAWLDPDATGCPEPDDWVELYNDDAVDADLTGWRLSQGGHSLVLPPVTLAPGAHLVVAADNQPGQGPLHAPFTLDAAGERLVLRAPDGQLADAVTFPPLDAGSAWGREGDGAERTAVLLVPTPGGPNVPRAAHPCLQPDPTFDDHTASCLPTREDMLAWAAHRGPRHTVKVDILGFSDPPNRRVVFPDSAFYKLHDEWYLYRMLNGQPVQGEDLYPPYDGDFASVDAIYAWAAGVDLPTLFDDHFVRWAGQRLTSPRFYELALSTEPRVIGVATVLQLDPQPPIHDRVWAFELEYGDDPTPDELTTYFEALGPALPPGVDAELRWLVRSAQQERTAAQMEADGHPYADRILRYEQIRVPGAVEVYHGGATAGRVRVVAPGAEPGTPSSDDVLILGDLPDELPAAAALITALPQTPLSHVSLLAESRGIPNAWVDGVIDDPQFDQWGRVRAWIALGVTAPDEVRAVALTNPQIATWRRLQQPVTPTLTPVDPDGLAWTYALEGVPLADAHLLRPAVGGKSAGLIALLTAGTLPTPDHPTAVSIRAGIAHSDALGVVPEVLAQPAFGPFGDPRARALYLEGQAAYDRQHTGPGDVAVRDAELAAWPAGTPLGDLLRAGGLRGAFEAAPVDDEILTPVTAALGAAFSDLAPTQGLRVRSSSTVEDAEGFNGAGLYLSETGFLDAAAAGEPGATLARAMQRVWGSFWGVEAYEERRAAGFADTDGAMGLLVHPRFDDSHERNNGVAVMRRLPDGTYDLVVNAQQGATSVVSPPPPVDCQPVLPEVSRLVGVDAAMATLTRVAASTEVPAGQPVLDDSTLRDLFRGLRPVVDAWLADENSRLPPERQRRTLALDVELRTMAPGWPAMADGSRRPGGLVIKQARPLEPSVSRLPAAVRDLPFPVDLLARAAVVREVSCEADALRLRVLEATTDPRLSPDMGHSVDAFVASVEVWVDEDLPELGLDAGDLLAALHPALRGATHPPTTNTWAVELGLDVGTLTVEDRATWSWVTPGGGMAAGLVGACTIDVVWSSPAAWVAEILAATP